IYFAVLAEPFLLAYISTNAFVVLFLQTILSTLLLVYVAEFIPKALFASSANFYLRLFSLPLFISYLILWPLTFIISLLSKGLLKIFTRKEIEEKPALGRIDLDHYVQRAIDRTTSEKELENEVRIFKNALEFNKVKARDCMIPRTEIIAIGQDEGLAVLRKRFIETELSKILIYRESIDNIIGYVHSHEMFRNPVDIPSILLPISYLPETMPAQTILQEFIRQHRTVAVVVDEFGGTAGILTIEDVIEEIFGEIEDEHDTDTHIEKQANENEYLFSGRLEIDYLNEKYGLDFPRDESYETLAGYILELTTDLPEENTEIDTDKYQFIIQKMKENRIDVVKVIAKD
ncbi:MAG: hemolysin family protein, partial [Flavobacteriales bacterium]